MANNRWLGRDKSVAQVNTITPANVNIGNTFTVTINGKTVTFTATAATVANVTAGLSTLLQASSEGEFTEITWADATTAITATAVTAGVPFTQTSTASGGTATLTTTTTTANVSPSDANNANNWSNAAAPVSGDVVYIDAQNVPLKWTMTGASGQIITSINVLNSFTGDVGLPTLNTDGTQYTEYRTDYWTLGAATVNMGDFSGIGSGRFKLDTQNLQTALNIFNTGTPSETDKPAFIWKGTHASNAIRLENGSFGAAVYGGEVATILTLNVNGGYAFCGAGCTLGTITQIGGLIDTASAITTVTQDGGRHLHRAGTITTLTLDSGAFEVRAAAAMTITNLAIGPGGVLDLTSATGIVTVTNTATLRPGATIIDPNNRLNGGGSFVYTCTAGPGSVSIVRGTGSATVTIA